MHLEIRNLSKRYPNAVQALAAVSLTVPPGMFRLLGPNGAGKSTLMRTLATLQSADSGTAQFGDIDVLREPERVFAEEGHGAGRRSSAALQLGHTLRFFDEHLKPKTSG